MSDAPVKEQRREQAQEQEQSLRRKARAAVTGREAVEVMLKVGKARPCSAVHLGELRSTHV